MTRDWQKYFAEASKQAARMTAKPSSMHGDVNSMPSYAGEPSGTTNAADSTLSKAKAIASTTLARLDPRDWSLTKELKTWRLAEWGSAASLIGIGLWAYDQFTPGGLRGRRK